MDALVDYTLIDIRPDSDQGETASNQNQPPLPHVLTSNLEEVNSSGPDRAQIVREFQMAVEQSLERFEGRIAARVVREVVQENGTGSASASAAHATSERRTVHDNVFCDHCNAIIVGVRYKCGMCSDYDLCEQCESQRPHQQRSHLFIKIYEPVSASLNQRPLLSTDLGATNPFLTFLGSLGVPAGTEATLEVAHSNGPVEIRELAQANGCQFYLRDSGRQLCKDYQLVNRSGRDLQAGEYRLEHVFSTGLFPLDAKLPIPDIPDGDVRIMCLAWQLPHHKLLPTPTGGEEDRTMRQATSVYRLKDRQGKQLGEPITASVAIMLPMGTRVHQPVPMESVAAQTEESALTIACVEDNFELISDEELPSCFHLPATPLLSPDVVIWDSSAGAHIDFDFEPEPALDVMAISLGTQRIPGPPPPSTLPPPPQNLPTVGDTVTAVAATATAVAIAAAAAATATATAAAATVASVTQIQSDGQKPLPQSQSFSRQCQQPAIAQLLRLSEAQDTAHPSTMLAAAYVPKTQQWMPPPPRPKPEAANNNNSTSSSDIWGPRDARSDAAKLQKLLEMGFYRRDINARVLNECDRDFDATLSRLSEMYKDW